MENHFELSDDAFLKAVQRARLHPALFSHEAHLRLAYLHIKKFGIDDAIEKVCADIRNFVRCHGAVDKFNTTLTVAAVRAVYHFMLRTETTSFKDFIRKNPRLKYHFKDLMAAHYGFDIYANAKAKEIYLEPDLLAFDCVF